MELQKKRLHGGREALIVEDLRRHLERTPKTGPGNKNKRERLEKTLKYLEKRLGQMNYIVIGGEKVRASAG